MSVAEVRRRADVLLSVQRALLRHVSAKLRAVVVEYSESTVVVRSFYDQKVEQDDVESMAAVQAKIVTDYPSSHIVAVRCQRCDAPAPIAATGVLAYARRE
jgi:hypothetical protein